MRLIKMFGLAAIAAAAVMAFVGASSAMATPEEEVVLCKEDVSPCPVGKDFPSGTVLDGQLVTGTKAVLLSSLATVECSTSTTSGTTTSLLAHGELTSLKFKNCETATGVPCTVTEEHLNYLVKGELNATHSGYEVLVTEKGTNGAPQANVVCVGVIECKYGDNNVLLTAELGASDTVLSVLQALGNSSGPLCGLAGPVWHAKYLTRCLESTTLVGCWLEME